MTEAVTDIIVARSREAQGPSSMVIWSVALHVVLVAVVLMMPEPAPPPTRTVMTISLGGAPGPDTGGSTSAGGRAVQAPRPPDPVRRAETPPAPKPPPMTIPPPQARPRPPQPKPEQAPREAAGRTPSTGEEPREGSTRVETGARGQGFGLTTGGGGIGGVRVDANFCCPEYLEDMVRRVRQRWQDKHGLVGSTMMQFTIAKDGTIQDVRVERSSGFTVLDQASQFALLRTERLPPLPAAYPHSTLAVGLRFDYQR